MSFVQFVQYIPHFHSKSAKRKGKINYFIHYTRIVNFPFVHTKCDEHNIIIIVSRCDVEWANEWRKHNEHKKKYSQNNANEYICNMLYLKLMRRNIQWNGTMWMIVVVGMPSNIHSSSIHQPRQLKKTTLRVEPVAPIKKHPKILLIWYIRI